MLLDKLGIRPELPSGEEDPGILIEPSSDALDPKNFIAAVGKHRHPARDSDPPLI
jgi:catalase